MLAVWVLAALFSSPYIAAKALAIVSPVVIAIALRGTLGARGPALALRGRARPRRGAAPRSSSCARRRSGRTTTRRSSREIRPLVAGRAGPLPRPRRLHRLGARRLRRDHRDRDQLLRRRGRPAALQEGRGRRREVRRRRASSRRRSTASATSSRRPASPPRVVPPRFQEVERTDDYVLYERTGQHRQAPHPRRGHRARRRPRLRHAGGPRAIARGKGTAIVWNIPPVIAEADGWSPPTRPPTGRPPSQELKLPKAGRWLISLEYDSRRPLHVTAPTLGLDETIAANLDFRGETPTFPVGEVEVDGPTDGDGDGRARAAEPARADPARAQRGPPPIAHRDPARPRRDPPRSGPADLREVRRLVPAGLSDPNPSAKT